MPVDRMRELKDDPFYAMIREYDRCIIEYFIMATDACYRGLPSHRDAVWSAMLKAGERSLEEDPGLPPWTCEMEKAQAQPTDTGSFLFAPRILQIEKTGQRLYDCDCNYPDSRGHIPYWYAFMETPHRTGYKPEDFHRVNDVLFPKGTGRLIVYEWTTDWSDYFDDGHEWWGAACWSVYDPLLNRYVVLLASTTD